MNIDIIEDTIIYFCTISRNNLDIEQVQLFNQGKQNLPLVVAQSSASGLVVGYIVNKERQYSTRPAGPMARRLTTNQEIAGSIPASVISFWCIFACHTSKRPRRCEWIQIHFPKG